MLVPFKKAKAHHLRLGKKGEDRACQLLKTKNLNILTRNYKCHRGEIDIVCRDGNILCFVEVKSRRRSVWSRPVTSLRKRQKSRIYRAAMVYLREINNPSVIYRFDLIEVIFSRWGVTEIRHWPNHFGRKDVKKYRR